MSEPLLVGHQLERFWRKVAHGPIDRCWAWTGKRQSRGYGVFQYGHRGINLAHRIAYRLAWGDPIPVGLFVCHHCDFPLCVNPAHLFVGTNHDNVKDMIAKGRMRHRPLRGEDHGMAKLTAANVLKIRASALPSYELARMFRVSRGTIARARSGRTWKCMNRVTA